MGSSLRLLSPKQAAMITINQGRWKNRRSKTRRAFLDLSPSKVKREEEEEEASYNMTSTQDGTID